MFLARGCAAPREGLSTRACGSPRRAQERRAWRSQNHIAHLRGPRAPADPRCRFTKDFKKENLREPFREPFREPLREPLRELNRTLDRGAKGPGASCGLRGPGSAWGVLGLGRPGGCGVLGRPGRPGASWGLRGSCGVLGRPGACGAPGASWVDLGRPGGGRGHFWVFISNRLWSNSSSRSGIRMVPPLRISEVSTGSSLRTIREAM